MRVPPPQASEEHAADARKLVSQLEARALSQATLLQEQEARLLAYATGQDAREAEVRSQEAGLAREQEQHQRQLREWQALVARREAALQARNPPNCNYPLRPRQERGPRNATPLQISPEFA